MGTGHRNTARGSSASVATLGSEARLPRGLAGRCTHVPPPPTRSNPELIRSWGVCRKLSHREETVLASALLTAVPTQHGEHSPSCQGHHRCARLSPGDRPARPRRSSPWWPGHGPHPCPVPFLQGTQPSRAPALAWGLGLKPPWLSSLVQQENLPLTGDQPLFPLPNWVSQPLSLPLGGS